MVRTLIFGGSFDPIHIGHAMMANHLSQSGLTDEVWLMPGKVNPLKSSSPPAPEQRRVEMCRLVADDCEAVSVCDIELTLPAPSFTSSTMKYLEELYADRRFSILIGSDNWLCFDRWRDHEWLKSSFGIIIYPRPGYELDSAALPQGVTLLEDAPQSLISSTFIRKGFAAGKKMNFFVPDKVLDYITQYKLYG